jgi:uncharacterized damage-inducible protein DinB
MDYTEMFAYFKSERKKMIEAFEKLSFEDFSKNRELSYYSLKATFAHTVVVEHNWLHRAYRGLPNLESRPEDFGTLEEIMKFMLDTDEKTRALFDEITKADLEKTVHRKLSTGQEIARPLEVVLYHVAIEVIHHYGEIFGEFWKMNIDAPYLPYMRYAH